MHIRKSKVRDRHAVMRIARQHSSAIGLKDKQSMLEEHIGSPKVLVACNDDDKPVGFLYAYTRGAGHNLYNSGREHLYVSAVCVDTNNQKKGVGKALMSELVSSNSHRRIRGSVGVPNEGAVKLYNSLGFEISGNRTHFVREAEKSESMLSTASAHLRPFEIGVTSATEDIDQTADMRYARKHVEQALHELKEGSESPDQNFVIKCLKEAMEVLDNYATHSYAAKKTADTTAFQTLKKVTEELRSQGRDSEAEDLSGIMSYIGKMLAMGSKKTAMDFTSIDPILMTGRPLTDDELIRASRLSIAAEQDAAALYDRIANNCENDGIADVFREIADEEKVHVGEFYKVIEYLSPEESDLIKDGIDEASNHLESGDVLGPIDDSDYKAGEGELIVEDDLINRLSSKIASLNKCALVSDQLGYFWVVTNPTPDSTINDILFKTDIIGMRNKYIGGLDPKEIYGVYKLDSTARRTAELLLDKKNNNDSDRVSKLSSKIASLDCSPSQQEIPIGICPEGCEWDGTYDKCVKKTSDKEEVERRNTVPVKSKDIPRVDGTSDTIENPDNIPRNVHELENHQDDVSDFKTTIEEKNSDVSEGKVDGDVESPKSPAHENDPYAVPKNPFEQKQIEEAEEDPEDNKTQKDLLMEKARNMKKELHIGQKPLPQATDDNRDGMTHHGNKHSEFKSKLASKHITLAMVKEGAQYCEWCDSTYAGNQTKECPKCGKELRELTVEDVQKQNAELRKLLGKEPVMPTASKKVSKNAKSVLNPSKKKADFDFTSGIKDDPVNVPGSAAFLRSSSDRNMD